MYNLKQGIITKKPMRHWKYMVLRSITTIRGESN